MNCIRIIAEDATKHRYFCTIIGSNTLALLAAFKDGQEIIFNLLKIEQLRFTLFSYVAKLTEEEEQINLAIAENALTILINTGSYNLYNLLFNRILADSKYVGFGSLSAITDTLVYLLETSYNGKFFFKDLLSLLPHVSISIMLYRFGTN